MNKEQEPQDVQPQGWTRREFIAKAALAGAGLTLTACFPFLGEPTPPVKPPEPAKRKEPLVTSLEVWWGSSTIANLGVYLYNNSQTESEKDKYDPQSTLAEYGRGPNEDYNNYLSLYEKSGHTTMTHGHYRKKIPHYTNKMELDAMKFPIEPGVFNLFIGGNEMTDEYPLEETLKNMGDLVTAIHKKHPATHINLVNLFEIQVFKPNSREVDDLKKQRIEKWRKDYNKGLNDIATNNKSFVSSISVDEVVQQNGLFAPTLLQEDGRHLTEKALIRFINKVRGLPPPVETSEFYYYPLQLPQTSSQHNQFEEV
jgi:hypothetical protein